MVRIKLNLTRIVFGAAGAAIATLAFAIAASSTFATADDRPADPAREATEAEIYRTGLTGKLEDGLGDAFGGVWFEPSTLQLHVGVTSVASRRQAEEVAAETGLADAVTETPVSFTWRQLEAAQERWRRRLSDLFSRSEATTALTAKANSVEVELSSVVPLARRTEIERAAAADGVRASLVVEPAARFDISPTAQCAAFKSRAANCDPPIVAGVTLNSEFKAGVRGDCTAGPLVIRKNRPDVPKATETFVLTAGHCFHYWGGAGPPWYAFNKAKTEKEIGEGLGYLLPGLPGVDVAAIKVESNYWLKGGDPPISPRRAAWSAEKETEPVSVTGSADPVEGTISCLSGQRSGIQCGTVKSPKMQLPMEYTPGEGSLLEGIAKVELETGKAGNGDSGGPFFSQAAPGVIQGQNVAVALEAGTEEGKVAYMQLLSASLAKLEPGFELLTTKNEVRHHLGFGFEADDATLTTSSSSMQKFAPTSGGTAVECTTTSISGATLQSESTAVETVSFVPSYSNCETFLGAATSFSSNGCQYVWHLAVEMTTGTMDIACPTGKVMEIKVGSICKYTIGSQNGLSSVSFKNIGSGSTEEIEVQPNVSGMVISRPTNDFFCPAAGTTGTFTGTSTVTGENAEGKHVGVFVG